jgi:hypothetical protein
MSSPNPLEDTYTDHVEKVVMPDNMIYDLDTTRKETPMSSTERIGEILRRYTTGTDCLYDKLIEGMTADITALIEEAIIKANKETMEEYLMYGTTKWEERVRADERAKILAELPKKSCDMMDSCVYAKDKREGFDNSCANRASLTDPSPLSEARIGRRLK